jgi:low affinity Fe/Cu permease
MQSAAILVLIVFVLANAFILYKLHRDNKETDRKYEEAIRKIYERQEESR